MRSEKIHLRINLVLCLVDAEAIYLLRQLVKNYSEQKKGLYMFSISFKKDRTPKDLFDEILKKYKSTNYMYLERFV